MIMSDLLKELLLVLIAAIIIVPLSLLINEYNDLLAFLFLLITILISAILLSIRFMKLK